MPSINELNESQQELLDILFWEEEGSDQSELIKAQLDKIYGTVEQKLKYLADVLAETKAIADAREIAKKKAEQRHKTAVNAEARIKEFMLESMKSFSIKKISGDLCNVTMTLGPKKLIYADYFDVTSLPEHAIKTEVTYRPIAKEVMTLIEEKEIDGVTVIQQPYLRIT